jgi:hypothetical protein
MIINVGHTHFWILTQVCDFPDFPSWLIKPQSEIKMQIPKSSFHFEYLNFTSGSNSLAIASTKLPTFVFLWCQHNKTMPQRIHHVSTAVMKVKSKKTLLVIRLQVEVESVFRMSIITYQTTWRRIAET